MVGHGRLELGVDLGSGGSQLCAVGGSDARKRSLRRTQPSCSDTAARSGSSGPSPATSSVEPPPMSSDQERPVGRGRGRRRPRPARAALRRSRSGARGGSRWLPPPPPGNRRRWRRRGRPRWRPDGPRPTPRSSMTWRYSARTARSGRWRSGARRPVASTPWPRRVIRISRSQGLPARVGDQQAGGVCAAVDGGHRGVGRRHRPCYHDAVRSPRPGAAGPSVLRPDGGRSGGAVHSPTGSSAPVSHQARWAWRHLTPSRVPPTPPDGRGPRWPAAIRASRSAA